MPNELLLRVRYDKLGFDKRFFDWWRTEFVALATLIDRLPQGDLYYYKADFALPPIWVVVGSNSLLVAYSSGEQPLEIREHVRVWSEALNERNHDRARSQYGHPVYAAESDPASGELTVGWFFAGDWSALIFNSLSGDWSELPRHWPESWRDRIAELAAKRNKTAQDHPEV